jgi:hypothetical protein
VIGNPTLLRFIIGFHILKAKSLSDDLALSPCVMNKETEAGVSAAFPESHSQGAAESTHGGASPI